ncbi:peptidase inhibitor family I36 protein [Streptomyces pseudovenezuelae]|uniref:peptidase inhibitor family I36 protein n=1 Tax=Streptomyces pseudovenezuelae TaxID=67350 RepID=UPI00381BB3A8
MADQDQRGAPLRARQRHHVPGPARQGGLGLRALRRALRLGRRPRHDRQHVPVLAVPPLHPLPDLPAAARRPGRQGGAPARQLPEGARRRREGHRRRGVGEHPASVQRGEPWYEIGVDDPDRRRQRSTADAATQSAATAANTCPYTYFCAYPEPNFGGTPIAVTDCIEKYIPWTSLGSWINHQTPGTRAQFRSSDHVTRWTDDGAYDSDASADWSWVYWVKPC